MNNYWEDRSKQRQDLIDKKIEEINKQLKQGYLAVAKRLINELRLLYNTCSSVNDLYLENRYYNTLNDIERELTKLGVQQERQIEAILTDAYYSTSQITSLEFTNTPPIQPHQIEDAVKEIWCTDGKSWSNRIWKNKEALKQALSKTLIDALSTGRLSTTELMELQGQDLNTYNQQLHAARSDKLLTERLKKNFDRAYKNSKRLASTELSHIQNKATIDRYIDAGVEKVRILTFDDSPSKGNANGPCDDCKDFEGKIYYIDDCPMLPLHPLCRCAYAAYFGDKQAIRYSLVKESN